MNKERANILHKQEDQWNVILSSFKPSIELKKEFLKFFNLKPSNLHEWLVEGKLLLTRCSIHEAKELKQKLEKINTEVTLIHVGIIHRNSISQKEIEQTLFIENLSINDYKVCSNGSIYVGNSIQLIEDENLSLACLNYLLERQVPII